MTGEPKPKRKPTKRAQRHTTAAYFDFNVTEAVPSAAEAAAAHVDRAALSKLFAALEAADDQLASDRRNPRAAVTIALEALVQLGRSNPHGKDGRFTRTVELLLDDLSSIPLPPKGEIFPAIRGWSSRRRVRHVQGCAAYALERLRDVQDPPALQETAEAIASVLRAHGYTLADDRQSNPAEAVIAWSRGMVAEAAKEQLDRLRSNPPLLEADNDPVQRRGAALRWLAGELERSGFDAA